MSSVFRVLEVFRPAQRKGPILVGKVASGTIAVGKCLVSADNPALILKVIAVDFSTLKSKAEGRLAVVVQPDPGDLLKPGSVFNIVDRDTCPG